MLDLASGADRAATALNQAYLASTLLSKPEPLTVTDAKGFVVQAWVMPAVGPKASGRRPTLLDIHGGPQTEFGSSFFHELQYWAGQGYNVVIVNPEGSAGYGHPFEAALEGDWGAPMFDDVSRVMDAVVRRPDVDSTRLGVIGGSYGGYATLWIISHTDRFRAAISERPASDLATQGTGLVSRQLQRPGRRIRLGQTLGPEEPQLHRLAADLRGGGPYPAHAAALRRGYRNAARSDAG